MTTPPPLDERSRHLRRLVVRMLRGARRAVGLEPLLLRRGRQLPTFASTALLLLPTAGVISASMSTGLLAIQSLRLGLATVLRALCRLSSRDDLGEYGSHCRSQRNSCANLREAQNALR